MTKMRKNEYHNLHGAILKTAIAIFRPFLIPTTEDEMVRCQTGVECYIINTLASVLNFTTQMNIESTFGTEMENRSWTGVIGRVRRSEVELGITALGFTYMRFQAVNYSIPYLHDSATIITRQANALPTATNIFTRGYSVQTWFFILCSLLFATLSLKIFCLVQNYKDNIEGIKRKNYKPVFFIFSSILFSVRNDDIPQNTACRVFTALWWFFAMVIVYGFNGMITSSATVSQSSLKIDNLEILARLVEQGNYKYTVRRNTILHQMIMFKDNPTIKILSNEIAQHPEWLVTTHLEGLDKVYKEEYALIEIKSVIQSLVLRENKPEPYYSREKPYFVFGGMIFSNVFRHKEAFNFWIRRFLESGLVDYWTARSLHDFIGIKSTQNIVKIDVSTGNSIAFHHLHLVLWICLVGNVIAFCVFVLELLRANMTKVQTVVL